MASSISFVAYGGSMTFYKQLCVQFKYRDTFLNNNYTNQKMECYFLLQFESMNEPFFILLFVKFGWEITSDFDVIGLKISGFGFGVYVFDIYGLGFDE